MTAIDDELRDDATTDDPTTGDHGPGDAATGEGRATGFRDGGFPVPPPPGGPSADSRNLAALTHLSALVGLAGVPSFIGPLAVWLWQRDRDPFIVEQAREALNFNLSILIYVAGGIALSIVTIGLGLLVVVPAALVGAVAWLVVTVMAAIRAADGQPFRYPLTLQLVR